MWTKSEERSSAFRRAFDFQLSLVRMEWSVLLVALLLFAVGFGFVREMAEADLRFDRHGIRFDSHLKKVVVALPALVLGFLVQPRWLRRNASGVYVGALVLLALVFLVGEERNNARRWIAMPMGFDLQPSELAKLAVVVVLARALYRRRLESAGEWVAPLALAALPMGMCVLQPDLGTALSIVPMTLGMFHLAGAPGRSLVGLCLAATLVLLGAWQMGFVQDYQARRIETWIESFDDEALIAGKNGAAFHTYHARVAIGNGGFRGTGIGEGIANRAGHLPERESDSIVAVIAEEGGFVGGGALILLYSLLVGLLLNAAGAIRERYARLVVGGVALYFGAHFLIHVGVNLGLLPMTGLTLPLLSTGGSSMLTTFLALGLALGVRARWEPSLDQDAFRS